MNVFRLCVTRLINGTAPAPILIPSVGPFTDGGVTPGRSTLRRGATGDLVKRVQGKCAVAIVDGMFGGKTEAAGRVYQRDHGLVPDGIVGPRTWAAFDAV